MRKIVIMITRGIIEGIYSDIPDEVEIREIEEEDEYDAERAENYWRNQWLIEQGCYTDISRSTPHSPEKDSVIPHIRKSRSIEDIRTSLPKGTKEKDIAYVDGFLAAWGSLNRYRTDMALSQNPETKEKGEMLSCLLNPLTDEWEKEYDALCDLLWKQEETEE